VAGIKYSGLKVGKGNTSGIQDFNKLQYYKSCMRNPAQSISRFHADMNHLLIMLEVRG